MNNNFGKKALAISVALVWGAVSLEAMAVNLSNGDKLTITAGVNAYDASGTFTNVSSGSYFGMDSSGNGKISGGEKTALSQGTTGLVIGLTTSAGASHGGAPTASDTNAITGGLACTVSTTPVCSQIGAWGFFGNTGSDYLTSAVTGGTAGLNFSGWTVTWNGIAAIPMNAGAWEAGYSNSLANFTWDGVYGHPYTLDYSATVPHGDPSGFGDVKYHLHMVGVVQSGSVIVASTDPATGATGLASNLAKYVVNYATPMNTATILSGAVSVDGGVTVGVPSCLSNKLTCVFPLSGVGASTTYHVTFNSGPLADVTGTALSLPAAKTFATGASADNTAPTVTVTPAASATGVDAASAITLVFSELMDPVAVSNAFSLTSSGGAVTGTMTSNDNITFTFAPSANLAAGTTYTITLATTAKDLAGNALALTSSTFTTVAAAATTVATLSPAGSAGGGCAMNPASKFDLSMILALLGSLGYVGWRRARK